MSSNGFSVELKDSLKIAGGILVAGLSVAAMAVCFHGHTFAINPHEGFKGYQDLLLALGPSLGIACGIGAIGYGVLNSLSKKRLTKADTAFLQETLKNASDARRIIWYVGTLLSSCKSK
jgi:hypothetical protein